MIWARSSDSRTVRDVASAAAEEVGSIRLTLILHWRGLILRNECFRATESGVLRAVLRKWDNRSQLSVSSCYFLEPVSQMVFLKGHDFSRAANAVKA